MITRTSAAESSANPVNSGTNATPKGAAVKAILGEFNKLLTANLAPDSKNEVSEEELFAAVVRERIEALKGTAAGEQYSTLLASEKGALTKADGYVPFEQAALNALKKMVASKGVTEEEGSQIYSEAFSASQLDANKSALFDNRGGPGDPTMAMATLETALKQARSVIEKLAAGETALDFKSLAGSTVNSKAGAGASSIASPTSNTSTSAVSPRGNVVDGPEGFLFKPITNNEGRLAVLLGQSLTGSISSVLIKDSLNKVIEEGKLQTAGIKETGREKWNFSKKGGEYPKDITVEVRLVSGEVQRYQIPDPSQRYD